MFTFEENFKCWDESYKPYGIKIETSSYLWHNHAQASEKGYTVYCTGNKYLLETPDTKEFDVDITYKFETLNTFAGISFYFGYNPERHTGYELRAGWYRNDGRLLYTLYSINEEKFTVVTTAEIKNIPFPSTDALYTLHFCMKDGLLKVQASSGGSAEFSVSSVCGRLGFSRPQFVGGVSFRNISAVLETASVEELQSTTVTIPTVNGGTMPLNVNFRLISVDGFSYLTATLDGGPQYRTEENYCPYPCNRRGQYVVEQWFMKQPYVCVNDKKYYFSLGEVNLTDPFLSWKNLLYQLLRFVDLPMTLTVPMDCEKVEQFAFGYEDISIEGYRLQGGKNEFRFSPKGEYLGETVFPDTFRLCSPADKSAVKMIPETVFDYPTAKEHFEKNHYFAEDEEIVFTVFSHTDRSHLTYKAELQNVYGEPIETLDIANGEIHHAPMPVGVYRIKLTVEHGGLPLSEVDTVFEVFDKTGKRCAPLESGLPRLFSMPNEQQYLDRDPFDPWNNGKPTNLEHFYSITAFTGHVAEYKRVWELTKKFGREWYVWLNSSRTMVDHDYHDHMDILKNADYFDYPSDYGWGGGLRSDGFSEWVWRRMPKTVELLDEFLDSHEGARERVGYISGEQVTRQNVINLHRYYLHEWYALVQERTSAMFAAQNEELKKHNPNFKRASYGPFNVYISSMRTTKITEAYGYAQGDALSDLIYTGFAQFEDYPYPCAYHTYRGAFGAGASLVHSPKLVIYPEQYKPLPGGCIDGAVYFANPPVGKYIVPNWFCTTSAREYVYNTPRKTEGGFAYWNTYGFMKSDPTDSEIDMFIRDWKHVLNHQPKRPMRSAVYVCEFDSADDGFETDYPGWTAPYNISEEGVGYLYETSRFAGLPAGFFASWKTLLDISPEDTDLIVLPSTATAPPEVIAHIRSLSEAGVSIIAVSRVDGLEDLFGVKYAPSEAHFYGIDSENEHEAVYPYTAPLRYESNGAEVLLTADGAPAIFRQGKNALFNISPSAMGRSYFFVNVDNARSSISPLLRKTCVELMRDLSRPTAVTSDGKCGITMFEDANGNKMLLVVDYSEHDQTKLDEVREKVIMFPDSTLRGAECVDGKPLGSLIGSDGVLEGVVVRLRAHESALIRLF